VDDRPPFDAVRAAFYLVAFVVAVHAVIVLAVVAFCGWYGADVIAGRFQCDTRDRLAELMAAALAAALAFAGGQLRK
jgi:hypothetical protein